jgi:hypothetical protein
LEKKKMKTNILKLILVPIGIILLISVLSDNAYACSCASDIDPSTAIPESDYAYLGIVTDIERKDGWQTITFDLKDSIKGNLNKTHVLHERVVGGAACGIDYKLNHLYFVNEKENILTPGIEDWSGTAEDGIEPIEPETILGRTILCTTHDMGPVPMSSDVRVNHDEKGITVNSTRGYGLTLGLVGMVALAFGIAAIIVVTRKKANL